MFRITWKLGFVCEFESWSNYISGNESIRMVIVCLYNIRGSESSCMGLKTWQFIVLLCSIRVLNYGLSLNPST